MDSTRSIHTPIGGWNQHAVTKIAYGVEELIEAGAGAGCDGDMRLFHLDGGTKVGVQASGEGVEKFRITSKSMRVGEGLYRPRLSVACPKGSASRCG